MQARKDRVFTASGLAATLAAVMLLLVADGPSARAQNPIGKHDGSSSEVEYFNGSRGGWDSGEDPSAFHETLRYSSAEGAGAQIQFSNERPYAISYYYRAGPNGGLANVEINGTVVATVDHYAPSQMFLSVSFNVGAGEHTITVRVLGRASSASIGALVSVDAFESHSAQLTLTPTITPTTSVTEVPTATMTATPTATAISSPTPSPTLFPTSTPVPPTATLPPLPTPTAAPPAPRDARYFSETGFRIDNDAIFGLYSRRGQARTLGFPVSRTISFLGFPTQFFQRAVVQVGPDGQARFMNLLDPDLMPFTTINFSTFPPVNEALKLRTPPPTDVGAVLAFIRREAPDNLVGLPVRFQQTFFGSVSMAEAFPAGGGEEGLLEAIALEIWGAPTGGPARDPNNSNFVYMRWQRGIMIYDSLNNVTQGILLGDAFKSVMTGTNLPLDLEQQSQGSRFYRQYCVGAVPGSLCRPGELELTDLTLAFERQ